MKLSEQKRSFFELKPRITKASSDLFGKIKVARASSEYLKTLLPEVDEDKNPDIFSVSFDAAVANLINANGDGILTPTALAVTPTFAYKPINIEHVKSWVVGTILNYGYSTFGGGEILQPTEDSKDPFNICLGGVIWRNVDPYFAEMVEDSANKSSHYFQEISASWEIGFDEYVIALGSPNLRDAELVTDDAKVREMSTYLRCEGGNGFTKDGVPVYRVIAGKPVAYGIGLTNTPAGQVKGLTVASNREKTEKETPEIQLGEASLKKIFNFIEENNKNISQSKNLNVKKSTTIMIKEITDITEDALKEAKASDVREFIKLELKKKDDEISIKSKDAQEKFDTVAAEAKAEKEKAEKLAQEVLTLKNDLEAIKKDSEAKAKAEKFISHLEDAKASFTLDAAAEEIVKAQIKDLSDEQYTGWKKDFGTLFAALKKEPGKTDTAPAATKIVETSTASKSDIPNAGDTKEESFLDKARKAFATKKD